LVIIPPHLDPACQQAGGVERSQRFLDKLEMRERGARNEGERI